VTLELRQWVIQKFDLWHDELGYVEDALRVDVRNNSAWNHRYFVVFSHPGQAADLATVEREIE
jgi:protein farnesyltransferase/geranylgeranyltransferase type-1 subunit alpha